LIIRPEIDDTGARVLLRKCSRPFFLKTDPLHTELVYLPFYLYTVNFMNKKNTLTTITCCVDGVCGWFSLWPANLLQADEQTTNRKMPFKIGREQADVVCRNECLRMIQQSRFFKSIQTMELSQKLLYPYWIGYFSKRRGYDFKAIDAVNGAPQSGKMRAAFARLILNEGT
jgi:hypothetical protein